MVGGHASDRSSQGVLSSRCFHDARGGVTRVTPRLFARATGGTNRDQPPQGSSQCGKAAAGKPHAGSQPTAHRAGMFRDSRRRGTSPATDKRYELTTSRGAAAELDETPLARSRPLPRAVGVHEIACVPGSRKGLRGHSCPGCGWYACPQE